MRVAIAGAGRVGQALAQELLDDRHDVIVIEEEPRVLEEARRHVPGVRTLQADACELHSLAPAELETVDAAIAATGEDQVNLVFSLLASQEFGVPRVVARINDPRNEWLFNEAWGIDSAVSTPSLLASAALEAVGSGALIRLQSLHGGAVHICSAQIMESHPAMDKPVRDLGLPAGAVVASIIREDVVVPPELDQVVGLGDEVIVVTDAAGEEAVAMALLGSSDVMGDAHDVSLGGE